MRNERELLPLRSCGAIAFFAWHSKTASFTETSAGIGNYPSMLASITHPR
jgi:hypothetical protein